MQKKPLLLATVATSVILAGSYTFAAETLTTSTEATANPSTITAKAWVKKIAMRKQGNNNQGLKGKKGEMMVFKNNMTPGGMINVGMPIMRNEATEAAIKANDYNAFVTAFNSDTNKPEGITVPTQEQFATMVTMYTKHAAVQAAIEANDYDAFVKAQTPTREEFAEIVQHNQSRKAIESAIQNKDYNAFITALQADTKRPTDAKVPTEEEFNKMIEHRAEKQTK